MHFVCPKCDRPLTKPNCWHYCKKTSIDDLFLKRPAELKSLFQKLLSIVGNWDGVSASASKTCVVFIAAKTFLVVKVMKSELDLKFTLPVACDDFPIYKKAAYGRKIEHYIRLGDEEDLDADVFRLIRQSFELMKS